jgi:DNA-directed RNA polymerase specialized sigma24 family protein
MSGEYQSFDWLLDRGNYRPIPDPISHSLEDHVRDAVERLGDEDRWLIEMKYYELCTYQEIADRTGRASKGAAYYHVRKALKRLRYEILDSA